MKCFYCIFHSFEAGIADAIPSFKWMKNQHLQYWMISLTEQVQKTIPSIFVTFYLVSIFLEYTVPAAQGLTLNTYSAGIAFRRQNLTSVADV